MDQGRREATRRHQAAHEAREISTGPSNEVKEQLSSLNVTLSAHSGNGGRELAAPSIALTPARLFAPAAIAVIRIPVRTSAADLRATQRHAELARWPSKVAEVSAVVP